MSFEWDGLSAASTRILPYPHSQELGLSLYNDVQYKHCLPSHDTSYWGSLPLLQIRWSWSCLRPWQKPTKGEESIWSNKLRTALWEWIHLDTAQKLPRLSDLQGERNRASRLFKSGYNYKAKNYETFCRSSRTKFYTFSLCLVEFSLA